LGSAYTLAGRLADAVPLLTQAWGHTLALDMGGLQTLCGVALAEAQGRAGRLEEARTLAQHALALACTHQERGRQAYALHLLGDLAAQYDAVECTKAAAYYRQALTLAEKLGMRPLQAHCHRGLGTLYAMTGQREQARGELSVALDLYHAMEMTFWLPETKAMLAQVDAR
jgi:tetratricopeptide (TPR) repeat protein